MFVRIQAQQFSKSGRKASGRPLEGLCHPPSVTLNNYGQCFFGSQLFQHSFFLLPIKLPRQCNWVTTIPFKNKSSNKIWIPTKTGFQQKNRSSQIILPSVRGHSNKNGQLPLYSDYKLYLISIKFGGVRQHIFLSLTPQQQ